MTLSVSYATIAIEVRCNISVLSRNVLSSIEYTLRPCVPVSTCSLAVYVFFFFALRLPLISMTCTEYIYIRVYVCLCVGA